jgi:D-aspartate ligase
VAPPLACVIGEMDLVRALGIAGRRVAVVAKPGEPTRFSRFTREVVEWADPWTQPEVLVDRLLAFAAAQPEPPVLYFDADWDLLAVSRDRERLAEGFRFVVADAELVEDLVDKERFQALADRLDLPVPPGTTLHPARDTPAAAAEVGFPAAVKPLTRHHETWRPLARAKAVRVDSREALEELWPRLAAAGVDVLVQRIVPGPESLIESYHAYVDEQGAVAGEFTGRKIRTFPREFGYTSALEITDVADVRRVGRELCERVGLRGVAKVDFKRGPDGTLYLLEINPRFNLWHHAGAVAGVNLPDLVYRDLTGLPRPSRRAAVPGIRWVTLPHDWAAARTDGMSSLRWLAWAMRCETKALLALDDPLPAFGALAFRARRRRLRRGPAAQPA